MSEWQEVLRTLRQPEYVHVLLNPLPVYGTLCGVLALVVSLLLRSRPAQITALVIVVFACASVWPVIEFGHQAYDRVYSMSNSVGQQWLDAHTDHAQKGQWVFYATGLLALTALVAPWKFPRSATPLALAALIASLVCLDVGAWISHAGGQIRHTEFRNGPPPPVGREGG